MLDRRQGDDPGTGRRWPMAADASTRGAETVNTGGESDEGEAGRLAETIRATCSCFNDNGAVTTGMADDGVQDGDEATVPSRTDRVGRGADGRGRGLHVHQYPLTRARSS